MVERKSIFEAATWAALIAFICVLVMGTQPGASLQPSQPTGPASEFLQSIEHHPRRALIFFAADSLFVLSYALVFAGLYQIVVDRADLIARIGLGAGLLTALLDATENGFFITYARMALKGIPLPEPALPWLYVLTNLKWMAAFATLYAFGWVWPRAGRLDWVLSGLMLLFPLVGVLGIVEPKLVDLRGVFFLLGMPLFAWRFWGQRRIKRAAITK